MGSGYTGGFGSRGGKSYWYETMQQLPYTSRFRDTSKTTEGNIAGKAQNLDLQTKEMMNNLQLEELERKYAKEEEAQMKRLNDRQVGRQKDTTIGTGLMTAAKFIPSTALGGGKLLTTLFNTGAGVGLGSAVAPALAVANPVLLALGALKWAQGAGLVDKNLLKPWKWRF